MSLLKSSVQSRTRPELCLASASPRRRDLLSQIGVDCTVLPMNIDESRLKGEEVTDYVARLSLAKARAGYAVMPSFCTAVLGADTALICKGEVLTKPSGPDDAVKMLQLISGCSHQVYTGAGIVTEAGEESAIVATTVTMTTLSESAISQYVATGEPFGKAGAYAIQGYGAMFVERIEGSYSNVVGLPLFETAKLLSFAGINLMTAIEV